MATSSLQGYRFGDIIGEGAFGEVFKATHMVTGHDVAVKVVNTSTKSVASLLVQEIDALKQVSHPNMAQLLEVKDLPGATYLVQELCRGKCLKRIINSRKEAVIPDALAASIFAQLTEAVRYLHQRCIFHRDIKPDNIILDRSGLVKLIDLGLCAIPQSVDDLLSEFNGTRKYSAPEVLERRPFRGGPADIWSLGVTLYNIVTASHPFDAEGRGLAHNVRHKPLIVPEEVSSGCREVLHWILRKDPQLRPSAENILLMAWVNKENISTAGKDIRTEPISKKAIKMVSKSSGLSKKAVQEKVSKWSFTYDTASYLISLHQLQNQKRERKTNWISNLLCGRS